MLEDLLKRDDVLNFINEIKTSERYFQKNNSSSLLNSINISTDIALYIFYDALFKYKVIIDDIYLFDEYLEQLDKLYKKLDDFENIRAGINKLICKMLIIKNDIKDVKDKVSRDSIINEVFNKYIKDGYFIHGFNYSYSDDILNKGFIPEVYDNLYEKFIKVNNIFAKYNVINVIPKDFLSKKVFFTDDLVRGCYYSLYAPLYFYEFLTNEEYFGKRIKKDYYLKDDYNHLIGYLKRFMSNNLFSEADRKYILEVVEEEWNLLHRKEKKVSLLLVKRKDIFDKDVDINKYLDDDSDIYEIVDRMLNPKYNNIYCDKEIGKDKLSVLLFETYIDYKEEIIEEDEELELYKYKSEELNKEFLDKYGNVSILLLVGSLFITLGVIITIIGLLRG